MERIVESRNCPSMQPGEFSERRFGTKMLLYSFTTSAAATFTR